MVIFYYVKQKIMSRKRDNSYTLELNEVMSYMTDTLIHEFPTDLLTPEYLILSMLDIRNCHANLILDNCLMSNNLDELRKVYVSAIESHMNPQVKMDDIRFNDELVRLLECAQKERDKLKNIEIGTEHILLAVLNKEYGFKNAEVFDKFRLEYEFIQNK